MHGEVFEGEGGAAFGFVVGDDQDVAGEGLGGGGEFGDFGAGAGVFVFEFLEGEVAVFGFLVALGGVEEPAAGEGGG